MATLKWNKLEQGWECSECGALYSEEEVVRVWGYNNIDPKNFTPTYCMDCGEKWESATYEKFENRG